MTMPTPCANRGGASASVRAGGPSLGRTSRRYRRPYGAYRNPASAPTANTTSCAASSQILPVIRTTASTITVIAAPNLGPRGSISTVVLLATERLPPGRVAAPAHLDIAGAVISDARRQRIQGLWQQGTRTDSCSDVAKVDSTPLGQRLRCPGGHEPDAMRARSGCHSHGVSYFRSITAASAAITSALRGRPAARLTTAPSG